uniref:Uncharacterized protein n=1 Tax=Cucumis melo TaxID=3656 RepID=A0A9I9EGX0_CUCME
MIFNFGVACDCHVGTTCAPLDLFSKFGKREIGHVILLPSLTISSSTRLRISPLFSRLDQLKAYTSTLREEDQPLMNHQRCSRFEGTRSQACIDVSGLRSEQGSAKQKHNSNDVFKELQNLKLHKNGKQGSGREL